MPTHPFTFHNVCFKRGVVGETTNGRLEWGTLTRLLRFFSERDCSRASVTVDFVGFPTIEFKSARRGLNGSGECGVPPSPPQVAYNVHIYVYTNNTVSIISRQCRSTLATWKVEVRRTALPALPFLASAAFPRVPLAIPPARGPVSLPVSDTT